MAVVQAAAPAGVPSSQAHAKVWTLTLVHQRRPGEGKEGMAGCGQGRRCSLGAGPHQSGHCHGQASTAGRCKRQLQQQQQQGQKRQAHEQSSTLPMSAGNRVRQACSGGSKGSRVEQLGGNCATAPAGCFSRAGPPTRTRTHATTLHVSATHTFAAAAYLQICLYICQAGGPAEGNHHLHSGPSRTGADCSASKSL